MLRTSATKNILETKLKESGQLLAESDLREQSLSLVSLFDLLIKADKELQNEDK